MPSVADTALSDITKYKDTSPMPSEIATLPLLIQRILKIQF